MLTYFQAYGILKFMLISVLALLVASLWRISHYSSKRAIRIIMGLRKIHRRSMSFVAMRCKNNCPSLFPTHYSFVILLATILSFSLNFCPAQEGVLFQGFASRIDPNTKYEGRTTNGMASFCTFTVHTYRDLARLDVLTVKDTGSSVPVTVFLTNNSVFVHLPTLSGEDAFGPAKGKYSAKAFEYNDEIPTQGNDITSTLLLPFWRGRYQLTNGARITILNELAPTRRSTLIVTNQGIVPDQSTYMYLCESPGMTRDLWHFETATNYAGECYPLRYDRTVIYGKLASVGKLPAPIASKLVHHRWEISITNIAIAVRPPDMPVLEGCTRLTDSRLGIPVQYLTTHWRSVDELKNDVSILDQLRPQGHSEQVAMESTLRKPSKEDKLYAAYISFCVGASIFIFGALHLARRNRNTVNIKNTE